MSERVASSSPSTLSYSSLYRRTDSLYNACVYMHRFYMRNALSDYDCEQVGLACLFLACKAQDSMKHVTQIAALAVFKKRSDAAKLQGKAPRDREPMHIKDEPEVIALQESMLRMEIVLLRSLTFDLALKQPLPILLDAAKSLRLPKFDAVMMHAVLNDSMRSTVALSYSPTVVAMLALVLPSAVADATFLSDAYKGVQWQDIEWLTAFGYNVKTKKEKLERARSAQSHLGNKRSRTDEHDGDAANGHDHSHSHSNSGSTPNATAKRLKGENGAVPSPTPANSVDERLQATDPDATLQNQLQGDKEADAKTLDVHITEDGEITSKEVDNVVGGGIDGDVDEIDTVLMDLRDAIARFIMIFKYLDKDARTHQQANKQRIRDLLACFPKRRDSVWREDEILDSF